MKKILLLSVATLALSAPSAFAITTTFDLTGSVTSDAIGSPTSTFGTNGDVATASLTLNYAAGEAIPVGFTSGGLVDFSISSADFSYNISFSPDGFNDGFNSSIATSGTNAFFATSTGNFTWPNEAGNTLRTTFSFDFGAPLPAAPATYDELADALAQPGLSLTFRTNGDFLFSTAPGIAFDEYSAELAVSAIPLPASIWLLLSGFGGLALLKRRRVSIQKG